MGGDGAGVAASLPTPPSPVFSGGLGTSVPPAVPPRRPRGRIRSGRGSTLCLRVLCTPGPPFACRESRGHAVFHPAITSLAESCRGLSPILGCPEQDQRELGTSWGLHPSPAHFHAASGWVGRSLRPLPCTPSPGTLEAPTGLAAWQKEGSTGSCLAPQVGPRSRLRVPAGSLMPPARWARRRVEVWGRPVTVLSQGQQFVALFCKQR